MRFRTMADKTLADIMPDVEFSKNLALTPYEQATLELLARIEKNTRKA